MIERPTEQRTHPPATRRVRHRLGAGRMLPIHDPRNMHIGPGPNTRQHTQSNVIHGGRG